MRARAIVAGLAAALLLAAPAGAGGKKKTGGGGTRANSYSSSNDSRATSISFGVAWADSCSQWTAAGGGSGVSIGVSGGGMERVCQTAMALDLIDRQLKVERECLRDAVKRGNQERADEKRARIGELEFRAEDLVDRTLDFIGQDLDGSWRWFKRIVRFVPGLAYLFPGR